jgi:phage gpG-like protein
MANFIEFTISGDEAIVRKLDISMYAVKNLKPVFTEVLQMIDKNIDRNFERQGTERRGRWQNLKASTLRARANRQGYYSRSPSKPRILRWTGTLQENRAKQVTNSSAMLVMTTPYAKYHHYGTKYIPARPIIFLDRSTESMILRNIQNYVLKEFNK